jgi:catechol 2,3-dioxygenase-like lactoylglutathione lyase family enzyme
MLAYVTLGTSDLARAAAFYDAVLAVVGAKRFMEEPDYFIAWGNSKDGAGLGITYPFDKQKASVGNGVMAAIAAANREQVDRLYAKAIELGGTDEGAPGQRSPGFYAAYFRDLDGNKLNICYMGD